MRQPFFAQTTMKYKSLTSDRWLPGRRRLLWQQMRIRDQVEWRTRRAAVYRAGSWLIGCGSAGAIGAWVAGSGQTRWISGVRDGHISSGQLFCEFYKVAIPLGTTAVVLLEVFIVLDPGSVAGSSWRTKTSVARRMSGCCVMRFQRT